MRTRSLVTPLLAVIAATTAASAHQKPDRLVTVDLAYHAPGPPADKLPQPNFSPYGTQVKLTALPAGSPLPAGSVFPAKSGVMQVGPTHDAWVPVLATADADHKDDLCRLYVDKNRNGNFADDGPAQMATPSQNDKTKAWWTSFNKVEVTVPYGRGVSEPYLVNFWVVREDAAPAPDVLRFSVGSWRSGSVTVDGIPAYVAMMDGNNDAVFDAKDTWCALQTSAPNADRAVLSIAEARGTKRLMFLQDGARELVLEYRSSTPDGRSLTFAVVDRPVTKAADRKPDDLLADERPRPRATTPFAWGHGFDAALKTAKTSNKLVFVDFETTWCGPCKQMDEWIYTDAEVAASLNAGFVGVKLDGDIEKALVKRFNVTGYPTMIVLDGTGKEVKRLVGYQSSKELLGALK